LQFIYKKKQGYYLPEKILGLKMPSSQLKQKGILHGSGRANKKNKKKQQQNRHRRENRNKNNPA